jgi:hypothetical protein
MRTWMREGVYGSEPEGEISFSPVSLSSLSIPLHSSVSSQPERRVIFLRKGNDKCNSTEEVLRPGRELPRHE